MRRPSGEKSFSRQLSEGSSGPPSLPKPKKLTRKWSNSGLGDTEEKERVEEPLYDSVPTEEPEDEYDNHLLYGTGGNKRQGNGATDTVRYDLDTLYMSVEGCIFFLNDQSIGMW